jgi:hypothetical protein
MGTRFTGSMQAQTKNFPGRPPGKFSFPSPAWIVSIPAGSQVGLHNAESMGQDENCG